MLSLAIAFGMEAAHRIAPPRLVERMVPLGAFITVRRRLGPELITRYNLYPAAPIIGSAAPGFSSGQALSRMEERAAASLPAGMGDEWTGLSYQEKLIGNQAYFIFALSIKSQPCAHTCLGSGKPAAIRKAGQYTA